MPPDQLGLFEALAPALGTNTPIPSAAPVAGCLGANVDAREVSPLPAPRTRELTQAALLRRGWTRDAITLHLGAPSRTRGTPWGGQAFLWGAARVLAAEATPAWRAWWAGRSAELAGFQRQREDRAARLAAEVQRWTPAIRRLDLGALRQLAVDHYNRRAGGRRWREDEAGRAWTPANMESDPAFLDRICVNYIRHALTTYDGKLDRVSRARHGAIEAALLVKARVFDRIADVYPELAAEAARQKTRRAAHEKT